MFVLNYQVDGTAVEKFKRNERTNLVRRDKKKRRCDSPEKHLSYSEYRIIPSGVGERVRGAADIKRLLGIIRAKRGKRSIYRLV